jgi:TonB family protein
VTQPAQALSAALLQFVWQGLLVAVFLWISLRLARRRSAHLRYLLSCAALVLLAVLPLVTALLAYDRVLPSNAAGILPGETGAAIAGPATTPSGDWLSPVRRWALPVWACGVLLLSLRLMWACRRVSALRNCGEPAGEVVSAAAARLAARLGITRPVRVLVTLLAEGPAVAGWLRPVILLPSSTLLHLTPEQLESVLAHELAHIRRHDYLVNLLQTLVETVLFYHPAVWWVSARIRHERELCCDDAAVQVCGDALCYARALAALERLRVFSPALTMSGTGGPLLYRIQRLAGIETPQPVAKLPGVLALALGVVCLLANLNWARAQETSGSVVRLFSFSSSADRPGISIDTNNAALLHRAPVEYPEAARARGIQGAVVLEATLAANGTVDDARVLSGPAALRRAALQSVLQWHFVKDFAGSIRRVTIVFDAAESESAKNREGPGARAFIGFADTPEAREFQARTREFENIRQPSGGTPATEGVAVKEPEIQEPLAGAVLVRIRVDGIPEAARRELGSRLPVHIGDTLTDALVEAIHAAIRQFDEHLEVNLGIEGEKQAGLHITAPNTPGIFEIRSIPKH